MSIFEYDSKFMTFLRTVGDLIILNLLFVICSIPLFTIGAAQAGLYTGIRELFDRDSNNSSTKSFFKGFKNGFGKITIIWSFVLVSLVLLSNSVFYLYNGIEKGYIKNNAPIIVAIIGIVVLCVLSAQLTIFHSKFDCSPLLLIKNTIIMTIGFPLRSLLMAILIYLPVLVLFLDGGETLMVTTPLWVSIYFSFAFSINNSLMKKPFIKAVHTEENEKEENSENNKT